MEEIFSFSDALESLKQGNKILRKGWNEKNMYLYIVKVDLPSYEFFNDKEINTTELLDGNAEFIVMRTADNKLIPWLASQIDILAEDWLILHTN